MGESDSNQFLRLKNQLVIAAKDFGREQTFSATQILTMSRDMNEQYKVTQRVVDVVVFTNRTICVIVLRYNVDEPETSKAQVRKTHGVSEANNIKSYV